MTESGLQPVFVPSEGDVFKKNKGPDAGPLKKAEDNEEQDTSPLHQKYPKYGWDSECMQRDEELQVTLPDGDDPTIYGCISISSVTTPLRKDASHEEEAKTREKKPTRFSIPSSWWEPCVWWLRQCE